MTWNALIIGGGPAALYSAKFLNRKTKDLLRIDLVEKLPFLGGLLRYGVAPDHPLIKRSMNNFREILESPDSSDFNVFANISLSDSNLSELKTHYDFVVLATGCDTLNTISIKGEHLVPERVINGFDMVRFYNNDYRQDPNIEKVKSLRDAKTVVIIGNGNVSVDISRMLSRNWDQYRVSQRGDYDMYLKPFFLEWLEGNGFERIVVVGRRGMVQSAFSVKEFREFLTISDWNVSLSEEEYQLSLNQQSLQECDQLLNIRNRQV
jgi:NADH dehydrogenase FAD-containing subunit